MDVLILPIGFAAAGFLGLILHEFGHAVAAWALGYRVVEIRIGSGSPLLQFEIGGASAIVGRAIKTGFVRAVPPIPSSSVSAALFVAAGPVVDVVLMSAYIKISEAIGAFGHLDAAMAGAFLAQVVTLLFNLWPRTHTDASGVRASDGLSLWRIVSGQAKRIQDAKLRDVVKRYPIGSGVAGDTSDVSQTIRYLVAKLDIARQSEISRLFEALGSEVDALGPNSAKLFLLDELVTGCLSRRFNAPLDKLDFWSRSALELNPDLATLRGSRGAVLVELGRYDEGLEMLAHADYSNAFDRCINEAYRTLAYLGRQDFERAQTAFEAAKSAIRDVAPLTSVASTIIERVEKALPQKETTRSAV